jgi:hypothetical protein
MGPNIRFARRLLRRVLQQGCHLHSATALVQIWANANIRKCLPKHDRDGDGIACEC